MTIEEYNRLNILVEAKQNQHQHQESMFMRENADELAAKYNREKLKRRKLQPTAEAIKEEEEVRESYETYDEPGTSARPFGKWQTVVKQ